MNAQFSATRSAKSRQRPRIIILGGGFGGAYCAQELERRLRRSQADIFLIDRQNYFVFYPLLVEAGTGSLEPRHAVVSLRTFLRAASFRMAEVTGIHPVAKRVDYCLSSTGDHGSVEYDYLVLALGSVIRFPNVPGLREFGFGVKSMADAIALRDHAIEMLELGDSTEDQAVRHRALHFVVVGGNFTGAEVAGEFSAFLRSATRYYPSLREKDITVTLVEITDHILPAIDEDLSRYAAEKITLCGVNIRLNESVTRVASEAVHLASGQTLATRTVIWCAGIAPNPLIATLPFPRDERGYILTDRDLRVPGFNHVWALGDCAVNPGPNGTPYPATAQHAVREAVHAARDIARVLRGQPTRPCNIRSKGSLAAIGCRTGVAKLFGVKLAGFPAWWVYRTAYLLMMPGFSRKLRLALDWTLDLFFSREYIRLNVHRRTENKADEKNKTMETERRFAEAIKRIDAANEEDPRREIVDGRPKPRELLFGQRVYGWIQQLAQDPSEELLLAARAHTLRRWLIPRDRYPKTTIGYHQWRDALAQLHGNEAESILHDVGYPAEKIRVVRAFITKENWPENKEARTLEDADCLVFLETKLSDYIDKWEESKVLRVLHRTLRKMTPEGRARALELKLGEREQQFVRQAASSETGSDEGRPRN